jgi:hypothetical protein
VTTPQGLLEQMEQHRALCAMWNNFLPERSIDPYQFYVWLRLHEFSHVAEAIDRTVRKYTKVRGQMTADHLVRFCSKIANNLKAQSLRAAA